MRQRGGFTLVELSIVLVIIGLLIGGILVAQSMISTAKIQAQIRQLQQFDIATNNFRTQFNCLPGEVDSFHHTNPSDPDGDESVAGYAKCDNILRGLFGDPGYYWFEGRLFFPDLSAAGMLQDKYVFGEAHFLNATGPGGQFPTPAFFGSSQVQINNSGGSPMLLFVGAVGNPEGEVFWTIDSAPMGRWDWETPYTEPGVTAALSAVEAAAIDAKIDDGLPLTGNVRPFSTPATGQGVDLPADYPTWPFYVQDKDNFCVVSGVYHTADSAKHCGLMVKANVY